MTVTSFAKRSNRHLGSGFAGLMLLLLVYGCGGGGPGAGGDAAAASSEQIVEADAELVSSFADEFGLTERWTGDLDGMVEREYIRVLVVYSKTHYFFDQGTQRGVTYA